MNFSHTWLMVLRGEKTQTRRRVKPRDRVVGPEDSIKFVWRKGRLLYYVGQRVSIQPGRIRRGMGKIEITRIRREPVQQISPADLVAEGMGAVINCEASRLAAFADLWDGMYGRGAWLLNEPVYVLHFKLLPETTNERSDDRQARVAHGQ